MSKTVTIRLDDETYQMIRHAAAGEMRSIANFIEYATVSYLTEEALVSDEEMGEILSDAEVLKNLKQARSDVAARRYTRVG
ncbi:MAG: CopG family transcriptional regulator [Spirochaetaceae bacterium]|nr:MAG: CopG family transcriptional regulator [Spirochaetaceae bacterium]